MGLSKSTEVERKGVSGIRVGCRAMSDIAAAGFVIASDRVVDSFTMRSYPWGWLYLSITPLDAAYIPRAD